MIWDPLFRSLKPIIIHNPRRAHRHCVYVDHSIAAHRRALLALLNPNRGLQQVGIRGEGMPKAGHTRHQVHLQRQARLCYRCEGV